ncbi:MAG: extracellular solute-binding protein [Clostridia bacterium]
MKKTMKLLALWLAVLLLFSPQHARASGNGLYPIGQITNEYDFFWSAVVQNGTLYFLAENGDVCAWNVQTGDSALVLARTEADLLVGGDALCLFDYDRGQLSAIANGALTPLCTVDLGLLGEDVPTIHQMLWLDQSLWLLYSFDTSYGAAKTLARCDSNVIMPLPTKQVQDIAAYQPGKLLAILQNPLDFESFTTPVVIDLATGKTLQALPALSLCAGGLAYDAVQDSIYLCDSGKLLRLQEDAWTLVNYVPLLEMRLASLAGCLHPDFYLLAQGNEVILRGTNAAALPAARPLVVKGLGFGKEMIPAFMREHPEIPLNIDDAFFADINQFVTAIQTRDSSVDIYVLPDSMGVWKLIDKGFALELGQYPALRGELERMNPAVRQAVAHEDGFYAFPISLGLNAWIVRPDLLAAAGYDHLPNTMADYFDMLLRWEEDPKLDFSFECYSAAYADLRLYPHVQMAFNEYVTQYEQPGQPLVFDTAVFRQVLSCIEALGDPPENVNQALADVNYFSYWKSDPRAIFQWHNSDLLNVGQSRAMPELLMPPPAFEPGAPRRALASLNLALINPYSQNKEAAAAFLAYAAEHCNSDTRVALYPDVSDPIVHEPTLAAIEDAKAELARMRELLASADDAHRSGISDSIAQLEAFLADRQAHRFAITADAIAAYRTLEPYLFIPRDSLFWNLPPETRDEFYAVLKRYAAGALTSDQLIQELDQQMHMLYMEQ